MLRVSRILHDVAVEGPGRRSAIWVQGCSIRCRGCINPQLFNPSGGHLIDTADVVEDAVRAGVEGLTFLGGEPFDQANECAELASSARDAGLGVICFTGYTHDALVSEEARDFLDNIDLLVDGPYISEAVETARSLVGSTNQRFIHLTPRYADFDPAKSKNRLELRLTSSGSIEASGFLGSSGLNQLASTLVTRRVRRKPQDTSKS